MDGKDKDLEGALTGSDQPAEPPRAVSRGRSPTGSTSTEVDYSGRTGQEPTPRDPEKASKESHSYGYDTDEIDHGEPDLDYEEAEEAVPGRELDRQLSRVGLPGSVSLRRNEQ